MKPSTRMPGLTSAMLITSWSVVPAVTSFAGAQPAPPVMLANTYEAGNVELSDYWISEKYDGVRAWWSGSELLTRSGQRIHAPAWFTAGWPAMPLDGELWIGRGQFESASGIVRAEQPDDAAWRRIRFMVFDLPAHPGPFDDRLQAVITTVSALGLTWVQAVAQFKVVDHASLSGKLAQIVRAGGEGLMLHRGDSRYAADRSDDLLKLKPYADAEAQVVGYLPGKGKYAGLVGALRVRRADGLEFNVGSGLSDEQRRHAPALGSWITYGYHGLTAKGVPRFARFVRLRPENDDETGRR